MGFQKRGEIRSSFIHCQRYTANPGKETTLRKQNNRAVDERSSRSTQNGGKKNEPTIYMFSPEHWMIQLGTASQGSMYDVMPHIQSMMAWICFPGYQQSSLAPISFTTLESFASSRESKSHCQVWTARCNSRVIFAPPRKCMRYPTSTDMVVGRRRQTGRN
jgi:hypothetical protein